MMMLLSVEPVLAVALVAPSRPDRLRRSDPRVERRELPRRPKLPFDIPGRQELMGGPLVEQSGPRLALFLLTLWAKQLVFALLLVELFIPWPRFGSLLPDLLLTLVKALLVLVLVAVVDVVNPRLRVEQAMGYYLRVGVSSLAALAFAVIGM
jgi:formate hydrogenlyase subunit 4